MEDLDPDVIALARTARTLTVLTGAGMSAESGVPTFRDAGTGMWARWSPEELATREAWEADPELVWSWYLWRARTLHAVRPHAGHLALARRARRARVHVVTQNVDDLHERAGSEVLTHLHGELLAFRCSACEKPWDRLESLRLDTPAGEHARERPPLCPVCGGAVRPGVVWFGEPLPSGAMERAASAVAKADLVLVVGTSGLVQPAASLPMVAAGRGTPVVEINPAATALTPHADHVVRARAAEALPRLLEEAPPRDPVRSR